MSYLYIKDDKFNPNNIIIKEYKNNLVLNYNILDINTILKNIIFKVSDNPIIIEDNINKTKFIKIILRDDLLKNLMLIDKKILEYSNKFNLIYIPFIKEYIFKNNNYNNNNNNNNNNYNNNNNNNNNNNKRNIFRSSSNFRSGGIGSTRHWRTLRG